LKTVNISEEILYTIEGSRFIARLHSVENREDVDRIIREIRKVHPKATHVVSAYVLEEDGNFDDDGEPALTAGAPLLSLLEGEEIVYTLITCIRYFGGVKLGKGGLIRAYSEAGREAIRQSQFITLHFVTPLDLTYEYSFHNSVTHLLTAQGAFRGRTEYTDTISSRIYLADETDFEQKFLDATQGRGLIDTSHRLYIYQKGEQIFEREGHES
jgi:uncharacterized YigZ family protein